MDKPVFKANGFLEKSYLDNQGSKHVSFEFSAKEALEIAKLELMGRDLNNYLPVLLEVTVIVAKESTQRVYERAPRQKHIIRRKTVDS